MLLCFGLCVPIGLPACKCRSGSSGSIRAFITARPLIVVMWLLMNTSSDRPRSILHGVYAPYSYWPTIPNPHKLLASTRSQTVKSHASILMSGLRGVYRTTPSQPLLWAVWAFIKQSKAKVMEPSCWWMPSKDVVWLARKLGCMPSLLMPRMPKPGDFTSITASPVCPSTHYD